MADDSKPSSTGPLASLITEAQNGNLSVSFGKGLKEDFRLNADEFVYIERDCKAMKEQIRTLQTLARQISNQSSWGLGESTEGLTSAGVLVSRFRSKAQKANLSTDSDDNLHDILEQHYQIIDDLQTLHHTIAQQYSEQDANFAAEYKKLSASVDKSPIGTPMQPGVVSPGLGQSK